MLPATPGRPLETLHHAATVGAVVRPVALFLGMLLCTALTSCGSVVDVADADVLDRPFQLVDGSTTTLADLQVDDDRALVVNLWATWCAPCLAEMPDLEAFHRQRGDDILILGLNISDSPTRAADLTDELDITYLLGRNPDGAFVEALGAVGLPVTAFIDRQGRLAYVHQGPLDLERLADLVAEHL